MKDVCFSHTTALNYWRAVNAKLISCPEPVTHSHTLNAETSHAELVEISRYIKFSVPGKVDLLSECRAKSFKTKDFQFHTTSFELLPHWLYRIDENVYVVSPELCLLQIARSLKLISLIEVAMELCGTYTLFEHAPRGFVDNTPVTSVERIDSLVQDANLMRGANNLAKAVKIAANGSASPRETELFLALTLPRKLGGSAIERPEFARRIELPSELRSRMDKTYAIGDLCWADKKVIAEYDGEFDHTDTADVIHDKSRRSLLASLGYTVIVFTNEDMHTSLDFDRRVNQLRAALGLPAERIRGSEEYRREVEKSRYRLRKYLFNPRHHDLCEATSPLRIQV